MSLDMIQELLEVQSDKPAAKPQAELQPSSRPAAPQKTTIRQWLADHKVRYEVVPNVGIKCTGDVQIPHYMGTQLPVKFISVEGQAGERGTFNAGGGKLQTMINFPEIVAGDLLADYNDITSLVGGPRKVGGSYDVSYNELESLDGLPEYVGGHLNLSVNSRITSLSGIHKRVKYIGESLSLQGLDIQSGLASVLLIRGLKSVNVSITSNLEKAVAIVNQHLASDRDLNVCQDELIEAGFEDLAML